MPRFNKSVFSGGEWLQAGLVPAPGAGSPGGAYVSGVPAGSAGVEHLVGEEGEFGGAPALLARRCWSDAGTCFEGPGTGVV